MTVETDERANEREVRVTVVQRDAARALIAIAEAHSKPIDPQYVKIANAKLRPRRPQPA